MLLTLISLVILVVSIIIFMKTENEIWLFPLMVGGIALLVCGGFILANHLNTQYQINHYEIQYDGLVKRLEAAQSDYEDVSKSEVIKDIAEWNQEVFDKKWWSNNPWTNWMNNKEVADSLQYIDYYKGGY